jgi:hypothetical protein
MRFYLAISPLMALVAASASAADLDVSDLRLSAGVLSTEFKGASSTTVTNSSGSVTSTTSSSDSGRNADSNWRTQLQYVGGHLGIGGGFMYGIGVAVNNATWNDGAQNAHVTTPTADILLGYGYAFTREWHIEVTPFGGVGRAYYSVSDNGSNQTSKNWNKYAEYGIRAGTYFALGSLVLGVEVPYLVGRFNPDYQYNSGASQVTVSDDRRNQGFGLLVSVGGRF